MDQKGIISETIPSEPEADRENPTTQPFTMNSSVKTDDTVRQNDAAAPGYGSKGQQSDGQIEEPEGQPSATAPARRETSEKKKAANRLNGQKSTGPKTTRGKANSRRNALKHCLLAQQALFDGKGKPQDEGYHALYLQLCGEFPGDDLVTQLRREGVVAAYWRLTQGLRYERNMMESWGAGAFGCDAMPNLHRYAVANQKALAARLKELEDTASLSVQPEDETQTEDADEVMDDSADTATLMEEEDNQDDSTGVTAESADLAAVDSEAGSSTIDDRALSSSTVQEVTGTTEPGNQSLDQPAHPGPQSDAAIPPAGSLWEEAESEGETGVGQPPLIQ